VTTIIAPVAVELQNSVSASLPPDSRSAIDAGADDSRQKQCRAYNLGQKSADDGHRFLGGLLRSHVRTATDLVELLLQRQFAKFVER